jgi:hypothetical protein
MMADVKSLDLFSFLRDFSIFFYSWHDDTLKMVATFSQNAPKKNVVLWLERVGGAETSFCG